MAQSIGVTLRLLGEYEIVVPVISDAESVSGDDVPRLSEIADRSDVAFIVAGTITETETGGLAFDIVVYDHTAGALAIREIREAQSVFGTFDVADEVTLEIASALSGRRIVVGSVSIRQNEPVESYAVFIDGEFFGIDATRIDGIPAGERMVRVVTGAATGAETVVFSDVLRVDAEAVATVEIEAPPNIEATSSPRLVAYGDAPARETRDSSVDTTGAAVDTERLDEVLRLTTGGWPEYGTLSGINPDASFLREAGELTVQPGSDRLGRLFALPVRYPDIDWRINGDASEWSAHIPTYAFSDGSPSGYVTAASYRIGYTPEFVYILLSLAGDYDRFLGTPDPRIKIDFSVSEPRDRARIMVVRRERGQRNGAVYVEGYRYSGDRDFREINGARASWRDQTLEIRVPFRFFRGEDTEYPVTEIRATNIDIHERIDLAYDDGISLQSAETTPTWETR